MSFKGLEKYKVFIYDFDGVIKQSVEAKTNAFVRLFEEYGHEVTDYVKEYHELNGGVSRYEKFKHYYSHLFNLELSQDKKLQLGKKFSELVVNEVINSEYVDGVLETIATTSNIGLNIICTGTPQEEIEYILNKLELTHYFSHIFGSPKTKIEIISDVLSKLSLTSDSLVYFGDSITDKIAADHHSVDFIGVNYANSCELEMQINTFKQL